MSDNIERDNAIATCISPVVVSKMTVCVELIGLVKGRLVQSPPFISNLLWGAFHYPSGTDPAAFFTAFGTAWVLARNKTTRSNDTFSNKNLTSFFVLVKGCLPHTLG